MQTELSNRYLSIAGTNVIFLLNPRKPIQHEGTRYVWLCSYLGVLP